MILPAICWDNSLHTLSGTPSWAPESGFEPENAVDWRDFSLMRVPSGVSTLTFTVPEAVTYNSSAIYAATLLGTVTVTIDGALVATYSNLFGLPQNGEVKTVRITQFADLVTTGAHNVVFDFNLTAPSDIRQLFTGSCLTPPTGQRGGLNPPGMNQGIKVNNTISSNGSVLGRSVKRMDRKTQLSLEYLTPVWVRESWEPFTEHAVSYSFFYSWDPVGHPNECTFSYAEKIDPPKNNGNPNFMDVTMPLGDLV